MFFIPSIIILALILAACSGQTGTSTSVIPDNPFPTPTHEDVTAAATATQAVWDMPGTTPTTDSTEEKADLQYQLDVSLDYSGHSMTVSQIINYTNNTKNILSELPLVVLPIRTAENFFLLSLQMPAGFEASNYTIDGEVLWISLSPELETDQSLSINLLYQIQAPETRTAFGYTDRQMLLSDWYAFIPPYLPEDGWLIHTPGYVGEYLAYPLADFIVNLRLSPPMESLVVAASAPLLERDDNCWRYSVKQVRNFSLALSPVYQVFSAGPEPAAIYAYTFPEHSDLGTRAASIALEAWTLYTELYGENPRQFMSIIEADLTDGLECDGLFYLSESYYASADETPQNYFHLLVAHETAHQWFYGMVPNDQAYEPWLDESLAAYSELLYLERYYPDLVDWWWGFRVRAFGPTGSVNSTIYDFLESRPYINAVYLRGVTFLQDLRDIVGDEAFFTSIKSYVEPSQGDRFRTAQTFFSAFEQNSDVDLADLLSKYFK